jgi:hypothetical protein
VLVSDLGGESGLAGQRKPTGSSMMVDV